MSTSYARTGHMTLRQGAVWLGMGTSRAAARRLQRQIEACERSLKREIMVRQGDGPKPRLLVTRAMLRTHCPEHFVRSDEIDGVVKEYLRDVREKQKRARIERRALGARIQQNSRRIDAVEKRP